MTGTTVRAVLTDLDGVIRLWHGQDDAGIEQRFELPPGAIKAITGQVSDEGWRRHAAELLRERHPDADVDAAMAAWSARVGEVDHAVLELVQAVRRRVPVALVTNATDRLPTDLAALGVLDAFDHIVNSSAVGAAKPDLAIYHHALGLVGTSAGETLYIDDTDRYLGPAQALGLVCHHYRGIAGLRAALADHGLLR